jgi:pSer/pThr/pTyr-binding forkhead associated (FHA) protein
MPGGRPGPEKTIIADSSVGKRLAKVHKTGGMYIVFQGGKIPLASRITIGRDPDNSISLDDVMVSRKHAVIQKVKDAYFVEDLGSTNGTHLNGEKVPPGKYMRLTEKDTVLIGRTELSLQHLKK